MPASMQWSTALPDVTMRFWGALRNDPSFDQFCIDQEGQDLHVLSLTEEADALSGVVQCRKAFTITSRSNPIPMWLRGLTKDQNVSFNVQTNWSRDFHDGSHPMTSNTTVRSPSILTGRVEVNGSQWAEAREAGGITVHSRMQFVVRLAGLGDAIAMLLANRAKANLKMMPQLIRQYVATDNGREFVRSVCAQEERERAAILAPAPAAVGAEAVAEAPETVLAAATADVAAAQAALAAAEAHTADLEAALAAAKAAGALDRASAGSAASDAAAEPSSATVPNAAASSPLHASASRRSTASRLGRLLHLPRRGSSSRASFSTPTSSASAASGGSAAVSSGSSASTAGSSSPVKKRRSRFGRGVPFVAVSATATAQRLPVPPEDTAATPSVAAPTTPSVLPVAISEHAVEPEAAPELAAAHAPLHHPPAASRRSTLQPVQSAASDAFTTHIPDRISSQSLATDYPQHEKLLVVIKPIGCRLSNPYFEV